MAAFWQHLRHACRILARRKGFTATAVLTLAVGIGANTALLSVVRAVSLHHAAVHSRVRAAPDL